MAINFNDPYSGGQQLIEQGRSSITPRETYGVSAEGIRSSYSDKMRQVDQLTEALSGFGKVAKGYEKQKEEEELKQTNVLASSIMGELNGSSPIGEQVAAKFPNASPLLQARVSETLGMWHGTVAAQKFIEEALTDKSLTTPQAVQARLQEKLVEESARLGKQNFYGPTYIDTMSKLFLQRGAAMSAERVKEMEDISAKGMELRISNQADDILGPKGERVGTAPKGDVSMKGVYDAFRTAGFSDNQARALVAEVGRENGFQSKFVYGSHVDAANGLENVGLLSFQGPRRAAVLAQLKADGRVDQNGKIIPGQETLDSYARFIKKEIETSPDYAATREQFLNNPNIDPEKASEVLGRNYIRWRHDDPKYASHKVTRRNYLNTITKEVGAASQTEASTTPTASHAIIAAGTNDFSNSTNTYNNTLKMIENAKARGLTPVVVAPNAADPRFKAVAEEVRRAAKDAGVDVADVKYDPNDPLHISPSEAKRLAKEYPNSVPLGDSNAVRVGMHLGLKSEGAPGKEKLFGPNGEVLAQTGANTDAIVKFGTTAPKRVAQAVSPTKTDAGPETPYTQASIPEVSRQRAMVLRELNDQEDERFLAGNTDPIAKQRSKSIMINTLIAKAEQYNDPYILTEQAGAIDWSKLSKDERALLVKALEAQEDRSWKVYTRSREVQENQRKAELMDFKTKALSALRDTGRINPDEWIRKPDGSIDTDKEEYIRTIQETSLIPKMQSNARRDKYLDDVYNSATTNNWSKFAQTDGRIAEIINSGKTPTVDQMRDYFLDRRDISPPDVAAINEKLEQHMDGASVTRMDRVDKFYKEGVGQSVRDIVGNNILGSLVLMRRPNFNNEMRDMFDNRVMFEVRAAIESGEGVPRARLGDIMRRAAKEVMDEVNRQVTAIPANDVKGGFSRPNTPPANATPRPTQRWIDGPNGPQLVPK